MSPWSAAPAMSACRWCSRSRKPARASMSTTSPRTRSKSSRAGRLPFIEYDAADLLTKALAEKRLVFTHAPEQISRGGPVIVTIGTPVDEFLNPVRRVVQACIDWLLPHLADGQLAGAALDRVSRHHRLAAHLSRGKRPQAENRVLSGARGAGLRHQGIARDAADRQRHDAGSRARSRRAVPVDRAGNRHRHAAGSGIRQAVQQRLSLHRIRGQQRILPDRALRRPRLSAHPQRDEAQLSARTKYSASRLCRGAVPGEGHDAARGLRAQPVRARPRGHADQRRIGAARDRRPQAPVTRSIP